MVDSSVPVNEVHILNHSFRNTGRGMTLPGLSQDLRDSRSSNAINCLEDIWHVLARHTGSIQQIQCFGVFERHVGTYDRTN